MNRKDILYIIYANPASYPPIVHSAQMMAMDGWFVHILGVTVLGQESIVFPEDKRIQVRILPACSPGWRQKLHYLSFMFYSIWVAVRFKCNIVYASDLFSTPAAFLLKSIFQKKVVYHEHDSPEVNQESLFMRFFMNNRKWLASKADHIVFPNRDRGKQFAIHNAVLEDSINYVWNCPSRNEVVASSESDCDAFWVIYHGSIVPDRVPLALLHALVLLPEQVNLRIIGYETIGSVGYVNKIQALASELGITHRIQFLGALPREKVLDWCRKSNVGLSFMPMNNYDINMSHMAGASNKPFDNLATGLPLLVSDLPEWNETFVRPGYALSCNPEIKEDIADKILWFYSHPIETMWMGSNGKRQIQEAWNYEVQFEPLLVKLNTYYK